MGDFITIRCHKEYYENHYEKLSELQGIETGQNIPIWIPLGTSRIYTREEWKEFNQKEYWTEMETLH